MARIHVIERTQHVPRSRPEVFAFFAEPRNLEAITPPFLRFEILPPLPPSFDPGALIDYRLRLFGLPFRWRTRIDAVVPDEAFVDVQLRGPYALWEHTHSFHDAPGGTRITDRVRYALPFGPIGAVAHALFVRETLDRIFDHRRRQVETLLGGPPPSVTRGSGA